MVLPFYQGKAAKSGEGSATTYTVSMMVCLAHKCQPAIKTLKKQEGVITWDLKVLAQVFGKYACQKPIISHNYHFHQEIFTFLWLTSFLVSW